jgi:hypothetical protein
MMDVFEAIEKRRTVRIFKEKATEEPKPKKSRPDFSWLHKNRYSQP